MEMENTKQAVLHRRYEMRAETLEGDLKRKQQENEQLSCLTDELIEKSAAGIM